MELITSIKLWSNSMTTLFKSAKTGATQQWSIEVQGDSFICTYGQLDGKLQSQTTKCEPKNIGRANATTAEQQAQLEADALVAKKLKSGYSYDSAAPVTVQLAMKVKSYQDQLHNVRFPCFSTPKLNGVNGIYKRINEELYLYSRGGELYPAIPHLEADIRTAMNMLNSNELNGELYKHGEHLQDIQSAVTKPNELSSELSFCIFDIADSTEQFCVRDSIISKCPEFFTTCSPGVYSIPSVVCDNHEQIEDHYNECMALKLEGTVIKNFDALYEHNVRSSNMFKYKKVQSAEFLINTYNLDKNGLPVFIMQCEAGEFKAKPVGTKEFWSKFNPDDYIGKYATIEYETFSKSGIPLKPVFISLRAVDASGEAKE